MSINIRYHLKDHRPYLARAGFPGEPVVHVSLESLSHVTERIRQHSRYARSNMLVQMGPEDAGLGEAVRAVVEEDRAQGYRWALGRGRTHINTVSPRFELHVVEASQDAADVLVECPGGEVYSLWLATPEGIARAAGDGAPFFYCPNLLVVRSVALPAMRATVAGFWRDLPSYAVLARAAAAPATSP